MKSEYTCDNCKETFKQPDESEWSEEDRNKEHLENFGFSAHIEPTAIICDDCHKIFMEWYDGLTDEEIEEMKNEG